MSDNHATGGGIINWILAMLLKFGIYIIAFILGVSAKWATRYKNNEDNFRLYVYDGVMAAAASFVSWYFLHWVGRDDLRILGFFISARYGDAVINLLWSNFKTFLSSIKLKPNGEN